MSKVDVDHGYSDRSAFARGSLAKVATNSASGRLN